MGRAVSVCVVLLAIFVKILDRVCKECFGLFHSTAAMQ
jgi:hypothetical protein